MTRTLPRILLPVLLVCLVASLAMAAGKAPIKVVVDGKALKLEQNPLIRNKTVYVPIAPVAKELGWKVEYVQRSKRVTFCKGEVCKAIKVGDQKGQAIIVEGTSLAPYKALAEILEVKGKYDKTKRTVTLTTP